jgi:hypothetical protein
MKVFIIDAGENALQVLPLDQFFKSAGAASPDGKQ